MKKRNGESVNTLGVKAGGQKVLKALKAWPQTKKEGKEKDGKKGG